MPQLATRKLQNMSHKSVRAKLPGGPPVRRLLEEGSQRCQELGVKIIQILLDAFPQTTHEAETAPGASTDSNS